MSRRIFLVGTDTDCGKTTVACALLRAAAAAGVKILPFKPAASGAVPGDPERLIAASEIAGLTVDEICPLRFAAPVAPGLAEAGGVERFVAGAGSMSLGAGWNDGAVGAGLSFGAGRGEPSFRERGEERSPGGADLSVDAGSTVRQGAAAMHRAREPGDSDMSEETGEIARLRAALVRLEARHRPDVTLIEGAGGLYVPMPGGSWLPAWIRGFAAETIVVGRLGLGTINHCLLTFAALEQIGARPRGFILAQTVAGDEPSHAHNERVIAAASGLPCLGVLAFGTGEYAHGWLRGGVGALLA